MESSWIITARGADAKTIVGDKSGNVKVEEYVKADAGAGAGVNFISCNFVVPTLETIVPERA